MGVQTIIELIERESQEEAASIVAAAERDAQQLVEAAEARVAARVSEALDRHGAETRAEAQRRINAVRLQVLEAGAAVDAQRLSTVFGMADERVRAIADGADDHPETRWSRAVVTLAADALQSVGEGARLRVRRRDLPLLTRLAAERRAVLDTIDDDAAAAIVMTSQDGRIEIDASPSVRLERARTLLAESVAEMLGLAPGGLAHAGGGPGPDATA